MTKFRHKENYRLRNCHINISPKCQITFKTKFKRSLNACNNCRKSLQKIGISIERYKQMSEKPTETMEWKNSEEGLMKIQTESEVKDREGKTVGKTIEAAEYQVKYQDVIDGLKVIEERLSKSKTQKSGFEKSITDLGKIPVMTGEMVRVRKAIEGLGKIKQAEQFKAKIVNVQKQIDADEKRAMERKVILETRPVK